MKSNKHPASLPIFFSTEMWERYGFYVIQTLLALFLVHHYKLSDAVTYSTVGTFTALTYISPIMGGVIADNWLGQKKAVLLGAVILLANYVLLALSSTILILFITLGGIAVGTGLLKPNISSLLGRQYARDSDLRDKGFIIFYMGITTGIILGTTIPSILQSYFGWLGCFFTAAIGMAIGYITFYVGIKKLDIQDYKISDINDKSYTMTAALTICLMWVIGFSVLFIKEIAGVFFFSVFLCTFLMIIKSYQQETTKQKNNTLALLILCGISVLFWTFYFQMFLSLTLFISRVVESKFIGIDFPAPYYVAVESIGMIVIGFGLNRFWHIKKGQNAAINAAYKFSLSMATMFVAYLLILLSIQMSSSMSLVYPGYLIAAYSVISLSELLLSPVGLSAVTQLSATKRVSTMMGVFFISLGIGGYLSGKLAQLAAIPSLPAEQIVTLKLQYLRAFKSLTGYLGIAFIITIIGAAFVIKLVKKNNITYIG